jgi:hypothetical protein
LSCWFGDFLRHPHTSIALQPSQPLFCIFYLNYARISFLQEGEEFTLRAAL